MVVNDRIGVAPVLKNRFVQFPDVLGFNVTQSQLALPEERGQLMPVQGRVMLPWMGCFFNLFFSAQVVNHRYLWHPVQPPHADTLNFTISKQAAMR